MRRPVTDIALLAFIAKKKASVISYTEATQACKSSSSASRALHQLIQEGMIEPQPKLIGLRYVTQYAVTPKGKQVSQLALHLTELRNSKAPERAKTQSKRPAKKSNHSASRNTVQRERTRKASTVPPDDESTIEQNLPA